MNHLQLKASKRKELVVDFRQSKKLLTPVTIQGEEVEKVQTYMYLRVHINKLDRSDNTETLYTRGQSKPFLLRRLWSMQRPPLHVLSISWAVFSAVLSSGVSIKVGDAGRINKLVKRFSSDIELSLDISLVQQQSISSLCFSTPRHNTEQIRCSFVPTAITLYNFSCLTVKSVCLHCP